MTPLHDLFGDRNIISHIFPPTIRDLTPRFYYPCRTITCMFYKDHSRTLNTLKGKTADFIRLYLRN